MDLVLTLLGALSALLIGAASPGPSFVLVARTSIAVSRRHGLVAALGMGIGGVIFGTLSLLGLNAVLLQIPWLYSTLKLLGGLYLIYLTVRLWRGATDPIIIPEAVDIPGAVDQQTIGLAQSFWLALGTQLSNPKTIVVYGSIFSALLPEDAPLWVSALLLPLILMVEGGWYAIVALVFSTGLPRTCYLRAKIWIDRSAACVMGALGLRLIIDY